MDEFFDVQLPLRESLLMRVLEQRIECLPIIHGEPVGSEVVPHQLAGVFEFLGEPGKRNHNPAEITHVGIHQ